MIDMLRKLAREAQTPEPELIYWVEVRPRCASYHCDTQVSMPGDYCEQCVQERLRGYEILTMTGRCANGAQRDSGVRYHAVRFGNHKAICGATHGKRSRWSEYHGQTVTCPRCINKIQKETQS